MGILKVSVREAISKRIFRCEVDIHVLRRVADGVQGVTHRNSQLIRGSGTARIEMRIVDGDLSDSSWKRHGQLSGWDRVTEEQVGDGRASHGAGMPRVQHRLNLRGRRMESQRAASQ